MWNDLHPTRSVGFGASPIPYSDVYAWLQIHGYDFAPSEQEEFVHFFYILEDEWIGWARDKEKEANPEGE